MKAPVLFEQGVPLRVEELDVQPPREGEVSVRVVASGVSHSCLAIDSLAPGGTAVMIGVPPTGATVPLNVQPVVSQERVIRGSIYGSARTREDFSRLVELYLAGKLRLDDLITRRYSVAEANQAFQDLAAGALARGLMVF